LSDIASLPSSAGYAEDPERLGDAVGAGLHFGMRRSLRNTPSMISRRRERHDAKVYSALDRYSQLY
jgi:hypothetical protein